MVLITNYPGTVLRFFGTSFAGYQETSNLSTSKMSYQIIENAFIWASSVMCYIFLVICWVTCTSFKRIWRGCTFCWTAHFFVSLYHSHWTALMTFWLGIWTYPWQIFFTGKIFLGCLKLAKHIYLEEKNYVPKSSSLRWLIYFLDTNQCFG